MGYITNFRLYIEPIPEEDSILESELKERYWFERYNNDYYVNSKWYDHVNDLLSLSGVFPDRLFTLIGWGEEIGDYWIKYFKNGKGYGFPLIIDPPPFDETKLGSGFKDPR